jgi:hypothetical protein
VQEELQVCVGCPAAAAAAAASISCEQRAYLLVNLRFSLLLRYTTRQEVDLHQVLQSCLLQQLWEATGILQLLRQLLSWT